MKRRLMWLLPVLAAALAVGWLVFSRVSAPVPSPQLTEAAETSDVME